MTLFTVVISKGSQ